jgi:hypothetical protein
MRNINILINEDHTVSFDNDYAGLNRENLQGNIVFTFKNFVDGQARAEIIIDGEDGYILLDKVGETYTMPIKSSLLTSDFIIMQLVIDEPALRSETIEYPVWKSEAFTLKVGYSINATSTIPEDYPSWVEILDELRTETEEAIQKAENVNISSEQLTDGVKVITTNQDGEQTITIVPQGPQGEPGVPGAVKFVIVNELPTEDIQTDTIYLVPSDDPTTQDLYLEYMYINNAWELLGQKQIVVDLTDYVKNTDYATPSKAGIIKSGYNGLQVDSTNGKTYCDTYTYANYGNVENQRFISKGTLENVITGKGLVSNTNYATTDTGGVIKTSYYYGNQVVNGQLMGSARTLAQYNSADNSLMIAKGTLENVLTDKIGDINSALDLLNGEVI